jgi:hypothetical protein
MSTVSKVYYKFQYNSYSGEVLVFFFMNPIYMPLESGDNLKPRALVTTKVHEKWKCDCGRTDHNFA